MNLGMIFSTPKQDWMKSDRHIQQTQGEKVEDWNAIGNTAPEIRFAIKSALHRKAFGGIELGHVTPEIRSGELLLDESVLIGRS